MASGHQSVIASVKTANAWSGAPDTVTLRCTAVGLIWSVICFLLLGLGRRPESGQRLVPERVEIGPQVGERLRIDLVQAPGADLAVGDQPRLLQHLQVLRDGRASHR